MSEFYVLRQSRKNPLKIKVCFAGSEAERSYTGENAQRRAEYLAADLERQHGEQFTYFVAKKEKSK